MKNRNPWILIVLALLCCLTWIPGWASVEAFTSPLESPIQPSPTPEDWAQPRHPGPEPEPTPGYKRTLVKLSTTQISTPNPTQVPYEEWEVFGLWQGVYTLLISQDGLYCLPDLAACN